jgi:TPR repeat protein
MAQQNEEQALFGIPHQSRVPYPAELTPYRPENLQMWREAAELGIPDGQYLFGKCLLGCGQAEEGRRWLAEAATSGYLPAKRDLGEALLDLGQSSEGLKLLLQAAGGGDALACEVLAYRCESGEGLQRSARKYCAFLRQAAALGCERAKLLLPLVKAMGNKEHKQ